MDNIFKMDKYDKNNETLQNKTRLKIIESKEVYD